MSARAASSQASVLAMQTIDFQTDPSRYRHWRIERDGDIAYLVMDVDPAGGLSDSYELKLNSYDLAVDIELNDAIQRLRFEYPDVHCVVIKSGKDNVFCAGANIRMLGKAAHGHKVNFCKFTNETRLAIEDATENSKQTYMCAVNGSCAGGGYELALATDHIMLVDDRRSTVSLPETPLLAVLPGTGGLTRVTDKRKVRRDRADFSVRRKRGCAAPRRSSGGWWMKPCRRRNGRMRWPHAPMNWPGVRTGRHRAASSLRRCSARSSTGGLHIPMSTSKLTVAVRSQR